MNTNPFLKESFKLACWSYCPLPNPQTLEHGFPVLLDIFPPNGLVEAAYAIVIAICTGLTEVRASWDCANFNDKVLTGSMLGILCTVYGIFSHAKRILFFPRVMLAK